MGVNSNWQQTIIVLFMVMTMAKARFHSTSLRFWGFSFPKSCKGIIVKFVGNITNMRIRNAVSVWVGMKMSESFVACKHKFLCAMQNNVITLNMQMPFVSHCICT